LFIVLLVFLGVGGYLGLRRAPDMAPLRRPQPVPEIPAPINQGKGVEPELRVYFAGENQVRTMKIEDYLQGVVAAEMDPDWPLEALAAQAIVARTFTLQKIAADGGVPRRGAHASTDIKEFQAYDAERINDKVRQAVEATRGQAAVYGGRFIRGWFHAYAGPRTALAREGLEYRGPNPPYIQVVESPVGAVIPPEERYWQASFPLARVREVARGVTGRDPGRITRVEIADKGPSGRVTRFRVNRAKVSGPQLRLGLGSTEMRSTFVDSISLAGDRLVMKGSGYGHGVGMCQWGARALAEQGKSAADIVRYYYRNIEIAKLW
jgi:stage II sporulation protein D